MFSDFARVFSRDFIVGYFLPAALFTTVHVGMFVLFEPIPLTILAPTIAEIQNAWTVSISIFATWLFAVFLLAANRVVIRVLEGYHIFKKTPLLNLQQRRFDKLSKDIEDIEEQYRQEEEQGGVSSDTVDRYMELLLKFRTYFPPEREDVLATGFGNAIRAFETYSRKMYGIDSIPTWSRIIAVVPNEYREIINSNKTQVDFAVNIVYLSVATALEYGIYVVVTKKAPMPWIPLLAVVVAWMAYRLAIAAAVQWGNWVKAIFDLYRGDLLTRMGIKNPSDWTQERDTWVELSQSFLYWYPIELPRANEQPGSQTRSERQTGNKSNTEVYL